MDPPSKDYFCPYCGGKVAHSGIVGKDLDLKWKEHLSKCEDYILYKSFTANDPKTKKRLGRGKRTHM